MDGKVWWKSDRSHRKPHVHILKGATTLKVLDTTLKKRSFRTEKIPKVQCCASPKNMRADKRKSAELEKTENTE